MGFITPPKLRRNRWNKFFGYKTTFPRQAAVLSLIVWVCLFFVFGFAAHKYRSVDQRNHYPLHSNVPDTTWGNRRHLLATTPTQNTNNSYYVVYYSNCTSQNISGSRSEAHGPVWEQCDTEKSTNLSGLFIFIYIFCTIVTFIAVAIVCDDFFVPTLEGISEKLELSEDVAGATFMAAGSSAPELFSSIAGVALNSDVGVGTITGSAVFNLLVIIALTAAFAGKILHLDWRPMVRDSVFYSFSIAVFIWSAWDTFFQWWEAMILVIMYILYIVCMIFNEKLMNVMAKCGGKTCCASVEPADSEQGDIAMETVRSESHSNLNGMANNTQSGRGSMDSRRMSTLSHNSLSGETKIFRHDRRNSVIHTLATSRPSLRGDEKIGVGGKRGSILSGGQLEMTNPKLNMQTLQEEPSTGSDEDAEKNGNVKNSAERVNETIQDDKEPCSTEVGNRTDGIVVEEEEEEEEEEVPHINCCCACCPPIRGAPPPKPTEEESGAVATILYILKWIIFIIAFPFLVAFSYTIPDCSSEKHKTTCRVISGFLISVLWIAAISFGMVTIVARMGCLMGVDSFVMSLVVLAAGTSIPDLLSSIIVARDGFGDMAVSNAIGSNVFDINLGLGFPFIIRIISDKGQPFSVLNGDERAAYCKKEMQIMPHPKFGFILLAVLALALTVFTIARFRLNKFIGISFFILYIFFLAYSFIQEFVCNKTGRYNC